MKTQPNTPGTGSRLLTIIAMAAIMIHSISSAQAQRDPRPGERKSIKIALLLDTSNSMDGLIDQAKSQLWRIVNELSKAKCGNVAPELKIALYEYGNDNLPASEGFIRQVAPLTSDLDLISKELFALRTNGGLEYCAQVINAALKQLDWGSSSADYKVIFIAGNEPFNQGNVAYQGVCEKARSMGIVVNTIFCGDFREGMNTHWKNGATITGGEYMSINSDSRTVYIDTPYDGDIVKLNEKLNKTYIYYGSQGRSKKEMQAQQDNNAMSVGQANAVERAVSKSSHVYKNDSWDLVDAVKEGKVAPAAVSEEQLPDEMKGMKAAEKEEFVKAKLTERDKITKEIGELNKKREAYIAQKQKDENKESMLDDAMLNAIRKQTKTKNFEF
jgi:hypothetical protein